MDIICARCGKHFNSVEGAREHDRNRAECDRIASYDRYPRQTTTGRIAKKSPNSVFDSIIWNIGVETVDEAVERHRRVSENISDGSKISVRQDQHNIQSPFDPERVGYYRNERKGKRAKRRKQIELFILLIAIIVLILIVYVVYAYSK